MLFATFVTNKKSITLEFMCLTGVKPEVVPYFFSRVTLLMFLGLERKNLLSLMVSSEIM